MEGVKYFAVIDFEAALEGTKKVRALADAAVEHANGKGRKITSPAYA